MSTKILVPLDGSPLSESIFPFLRYFAEHLSQPVLINLVRCYELPTQIYSLPELAVTDPDFFSTAKLEDAIKSYLEEQKKALTGLEVTTTTVLDDPATGILELSEDHDMIVMSSHGRGGLKGWLLGSVATKVTRGAETPVLIVNSGANFTDSSKIETIMVALDGSPVSERAFDKAAEMAGQLGAEIHLYQSVHAAPVLHEVIADANLLELKKAENYLEELAAKLPDSIPVETHVQQTVDAPEIVKYAENHDVDLIVMGSHGKSGVLRWMLGSQTENVLHKANRPVLVTH